MQGSGKGNRFSDGQPRTSANGERVIDLRSWRNKRRVEGLKQRYLNPTSRFRFIGILFAAAAAVMAIIGCFPTPSQNHFILICWLIGLVGMCYALFLHVRYDSIARRLLLANVCCLVLSFAAALYKLFH